MYAVIQTGGKQYRVTPGELVKVEKLPGNKGDQVTFEKVLLTSDGETVNIGNPFLPDIKVQGRIARQGRDRKILVFKYKRRKDYRKKIGHRQSFTLVKVDDIAK
jgi:large subunit ribosomal protein L21